MGQADSCVGAARAGVEDAPTPAGVAGASGACSRWVLKLLRQSAIRGAGSVACSFWPSVSLSLCATLVRVHPTNSRARRWCPDPRSRSRIPAHAVPAVNAGGKSERASAGGQGLLVGRVLLGLACANLALHLAEVPWLAKQANPVTPAGDLYYQLVRTRDELAAVREQNVMLRDMLGAGPLDSEAKLMNKYRRLVDLQNAYVTKRIDPAALPPTPELDADRKKKPFGSRPTNLDMPTGELD